MSRYMNCGGAPSVPAQAAAPPPPPPAPQAGTTAKPADSASGSSGSGRPARGKASLVRRDDVASSLNTGAGSSAGLQI